MSKKFQNKGRRKFIKQASCAALGYTTIFSTLNSLKAANAAAIMNSSTLLGGDYKALVCLMFSGGNDSFNMLIPRGNAEYNEYMTTRSNQSIPQNDILPITPNTSDGKQYGLHPALGGVQQMFQNGNAAFLSNVGTLVEPMTRQQYEQGTAAVPLGLYSHSDQVMHWQTAVPQDRASIGWGGKMADLMQSANDNTNIAMNISMSGNNVFQVGQNTVEYSLNPYDGSYGLLGYNDPWASSMLRKGAIDNMLDKHYTDIFKHAYVDVVRNAKSAHEEFSTALEGLSPFDTQFTDSDLSQSFHMVAKTIAMRETLGMKRQIFFIDYGGWDHHDEVLDNQMFMFGEVNNAIVEFQAAMQEMGLTDCVTTFTASEFGRTLTSNGNGTDHGWGGNSLVVGGAVNGKDIYGNFPSLELDAELEIGGGVLIPTLSCDEYFSELAMWYGVTPSELPIILPNIGNFYSPGGGNPPPIGFMNI